MLTSSTSHVSFPPLPSHIATIDDCRGDQGPSPEEVHRRVREIRESWDMQERIARRREARNRFEHLLEALYGNHAA